MRSRYSLFVLVALTCLSCAEEPKPIDYSHAADFTYTYAGLLQANAPVTFRSVSADAQAYEWDFGDGLAPATGQQAVHTFAKNGLFTVKLTASTAGGVKTSTQQLTIAVDYSHAADFTYYGSLYLNEPITFSGASSLAQGYQWDFGDGTAPGTGRSIVHTFTRGGTFPVTLTAATAGGPIASTRQLVISQDTLSPYFAAVVGDYRLTQEYYSYNYGVVTPCDILVTAVRSGNRLVLQYAGGGGTLDDLALAPLSYKPGYYSFGKSDYRSHSYANFKIGRDSIFLDSYYGGLGGGTTSWKRGKRR